MGRGQFGGQINESRLIKFKTAGDALGLIFEDLESEDYPTMRTKQVFRRQIKIGEIFKEVNNMTNKNMGNYDGSKKDAQVVMQPEMRDALRVAGQVLVDMADITDSIILPDFGNETHSLIAQIVTARTTGMPIDIFSPVCPDWSRDTSGRYDFKSLGGDASFIARKVFQEAPPILGILKKHNISYKGTLVLANYGSETEIDARDTYGRKLNPEDIEMSFASTYAKTDEELSELQTGDGGVFDTYRVIPMTEFFEKQKIDVDQLFDEANEFFRINNKGRKLVEQLHRDSVELNKKRLGMSEVENLAQTIRGCAEYGLFGYALGKKGIILAAESRTTSRAYNLFRRAKRREVMPLFYLKGKRGINEGVNIL